MTNTNERAATPEDLTRLFVERANARDAEGMAELYEADAVLAYPPGNEVRGREAILESCRALVARGVAFQLETRLPTVQHADLALVSTLSADGVGVRTQLVRRQADGHWLRVIHRPEATARQG